jgi:nifR3 family TIM-barrel protein
MGNGLVDTKPFIRLQGPIPHHKPTSHFPLPISSPSLYHPLTIGSLSLPGNLFLAPVAGYTDRAFRRVCGELGADFSFTELVSVEALRRHPGRYGLGNVPQQPVAGPAGGGLIGRGGDTPYGVQLFGADPEALYEAASYLAPLRLEALDINGGCPVPKVVKTGAGAALMKTPALLGRLTAAAVRASRDFLQGIPVTVKIRSGWDSASINYLECAAAAVEAGAALVSLHPRTRSQGYAGRSDWACIRDLSSRLPVPVAGSGDLYTPEDARRMLAETGCAAVLFARGALGNPFIFSQTRALLQGRPWEEPTPEERLGAALRHLRLLVEDLSGEAGGEKRACLEMRKQFCAYTRGLPGGSALRNLIIHAESIAQYEEIVKAG